MQLRHKNRGFTIFELLVTLSMFTLLSTLMIANYRSSTKGLLLNTLAHQIITEVRHAQTFATANVSNAGIYSPYGIFFDINVPKSFTLFSDFGSPRNKIYDGGAELVQNFSLKGGNTISKLCVNMKKDNKTTADCTEVPRLHVTFTRPYPEPTFRATDASNVIVGPPTITDVDVVLSSDTGQQKTLIIWIMGQIVIE